MTNDELLELIDRRTQIGYAMPNSKALRAVVEIHNIDPNGLQGDCGMCEVSYPCPTILAIEKELE